MPIKTENDTLSLSNSHAGCMWVFALFLIIPFAIGIFLLWSDPSVDTPQWIILLFTICVVGGLWLLVRQVSRGTLIKVQFRKSDGVISIQHRTLRAKWNEERHTSQIKELLIEASDNDGEFFNCYLVFSDDERLHVVHGNYRIGVYEEVDALQTFLEEAGARIHRKEVKV